MSIHRDQARKQILATYGIGADEVFNKSEDNEIEKGGKGSGRHKGMQKFLDKFPNNANTWHKATDEIRDLAQSARQHINEYDKDVSEDHPNAHPALDFRAIKTPSEWNTKGKAYINDAYSQMSDRAKKSFVSQHAEWFGEKPMEKSETEDMTIEKAQSIAEEYFEKGKKAVIGEKRSFGGREYIKTAEGWKFHGKGTGAKANEHVKAALGHHVEEKTGMSKNPDDEFNDKLIPELEEDAKKTKVKETGNVDAETGRKLTPLEETIASHQNGTSKPTSLQDVKAGHKVKYFSSGGKAMGKNDEGHEVVRTTPTKIVVKYNAPGAPAHGKEMEFRRKDGRSLKDLKWDAYRTSTIDV